MTKALSNLPPGWWRARRYHLIAPLVALAVVALFEQTWVAEYLEDQTVNLRFRERASYDPPADQRILFLGIDQQSLDLLGKYPWPRTTIAAFLTDVAQTNSNPYAVTFDILYTERSANPADDAALGEAADLLPNVITGALSVRPAGVAGDENPEVIAAAEAKTKAELAVPGPTMPFTHVNGDIQQIRGSNIATLPVEPLRQKSLFGFVNDDPSKIDYIRHTIPLVMRLDDHIYPSLALQTICQMLGISDVVVNVGKNVVLKNSSGKTWTIPITPDGQYFINYRRNDSFQSLSFGQLVKALEENVSKGTPIPPQCDIKNKVLLVGEAATSLTDLGPTPLQAASPLPYTHLDVINNILKNDYLSFVPWGWVVLGWSLVTWPTLLRLKVAPLVEAVVVPILVVILYAVTVTWVFGRWSVIIPMAWPILSYTVVNFGGVVLRWQEEQKGRQQIRGVFAQMLSPEVMNHLLKHPENVQLGGADRPSTILFSDIRDYTKFSEGKTAAEVMRQLNTYFERMVPCITEKKGTVHKFIGDAVMAAWGDIADTSMGPEQDARNAVSSALLMRVRLRTLNEERKELGLTPIRIGVGLNHGIVQAGILGSTGRKEFTMIGDEVNVASRLEGITKEFRTDLAISESVRLLIGDSFLVRRLGFIQLKGKTQATLVFEVLAEKSDLAQVKMSPEAVAQYETAFDHFVARRFAEAEAAFVAFLKDYPDDFCGKNYLEKSREFIVTPPPPEWDGRIVMTTK